MKKSSNVLLSAVFLTTVASFMADSAHAQQHIANEPAASSLQNNEQDSSSNHRVYPNTVHRGFFGRLFHRNPKPSTTQNTVNDGPRRTENTMSKVATIPKSSGGFGSTGTGSAHS